MYGMPLLSFRLFRKNLGNLREFFGQMVPRPPGKKIARTPMVSGISKSFIDLSSQYFPSIISIAT